MQRPLPWAVIAIFVGIAGFVLWRWWPPARRRAWSLGSPSLSRLRTNSQWSWWTGHLTRWSLPGLLGHGIETGPTTLLAPHGSKRTSVNSGDRRSCGPFFSPDGEWIAFTAGGQLKRPVAWWNAHFGLCQDKSKYRKLGARRHDFLYRTLNPTGNQNGRLMRVPGLEVNPECDAAEKTPTNSLLGGRKFCRGDAFST